MRPVSTSISTPALLRGASSILSSSSRMRSGAIRASRPEFLQTDAYVSASMATSRVTAKRTARIRRRESSSKRQSGFPIARRIPASMSATPST